MSGDLLRWKLPLVAFVIAAALAPAVHASPLGDVPPSLYAIYGSATDALGRPLEHVRIIDDSGFTSTNSDGEYRRPQKGFAPTHLTAARNDLVNQSRTVQPLLPFDTREDFTLLYRISATTEWPWVSTAGAPASHAVTGTGWAPTPGTAETVGSSCTYVRDGRTGTVGAAAWKGAGPGESTHWERVLTLDAGSAEGVYGLDWWSEDCASSTVLTPVGHSTYTIDNSIPVISEIGYEAGDAGHVLRATVVDRGPSGIRLDGIQFRLTDVADSTVVTSQSTYGASGEARSIDQVSLVPGRTYVIDVVAADRAGNVAAASLRFVA